MYKISSAFHVDVCLTVFFDDGSVRSIDLLPYMDISLDDVLSKPLSAKNMPVHTNGHALIWDDAELSADFLYHNSLPVGTWNDHRSNWRYSVEFAHAEVRAERENERTDSYLLLDGVRYPALRISSGWFGIYENIAWYDVPYPGDDGKGNDVPELEESQAVFDTLKQLTQTVNDILAQKSSVKLDITEMLQQSGGKLRAAFINPRASALRAKRYKHHTDK